MIIKNNKRSQQEMVGFIVIVVMVLVIGVIFLGISIRNSMTGGVEATDAEIANFLSASTGIKTDCAKDYEPNYRDIEDIIGDCYQSKECIDGRKACEVLNQTYSALLPEFRPAGRHISAYRLTFYYQENASVPIENSRRLDELTIYSGEVSVCASTRAGRTDISLGGYNIAKILEICLEE